MKNLGYFSDRNPIRRLLDNFKVFVIKLFKGADLRDTKIDEKTKLNSKWEIVNNFFQDCFNGNFDNVEFILECHDPNMCDSDGATGLHWAARASRSTIVRVLLERGLRRRHT